VLSFGGHFYIGRFATRLVSRGKVEAPVNKVDLGGKRGRVTMMPRVVLEMVSKRRVSTTVNIRLRVIILY
jgi:hypothetical protein